ncbi:MAG: hypothetical protein HeimC2_19190 [Candidatus Heimdallarchaeota archaeon LC_2]|nr:MAG: hypothetical protein HeimC2_19190 [Candidatus Heimdallarchaeota archaeon LC_2]
MKKANLNVFLLFIFLIIPIPNSNGAVPLIMDGNITNGEWDESYSQTIRMSIGIDISLKTQYTETDAYFLVTFSKNSPGDEINRDPSTGSHDYFGIEFDNNNDGAIMGTEGSPDDMILIDYDRVGALDMYSHSYHVFIDENNQGTNNVEGQSNDVDGFLIYEFRKSLNSTDSKGFDISLKEGDKYYIMPAIWDDEFLGETTTTINTQIGNTIFIEMIVGEPAETFTQNIFIGFAIAISLGVFGLLIYLKSRST